jgi:hypothetical protein
VKDLGIYGVTLIFIVVINSYINIFPWWAMGGFVVLLGVVLLYYGKGGDGIDFTFSGIDSGQDSSDDLQVLVDPDEAPEKLNEKVRNHPARKELQIDRTNRDSTDYKEEAREVTINGKEKLFWGVIGRPRSSRFSEKCRYIYNLTNDRIYAYDADIKSIEGRLEPFYGYKWLTVRGRDATSSSGGKRRNQLIINQGDEPSAGSSNDGGGS